MDPNTARRRSTRLSGYDYRRPGIYFVTLCTQKKEPLFGQIIDGLMNLNDLGQIVVEEWIASAHIRREIELDEWVVMPNHLHGIVIIVDASIRATDRSPKGATGTSSAQPADPLSVGATGTSSAQPVAPLPVVGATGASSVQPVVPLSVGATGASSVQSVGATGRSPLPRRRARGPGKRSLGALIAGFKSAATKRINILRGTPGKPVWQRNYYDHIIRNERELQNIRQYIHDNPLKWALDRDR